MYEDFDVYGPYKRKDGRSHMCLVHKDTKQRKTVSYPKYLIECKLGRPLTDNENVHHIDENVENNEESNLQIVNKSDHTRYHSTLRFKYTPEYWTCIVCGHKWLATRQEIRQKISKQNRLNRELKGPFCSRQCQGKICN